MACMVLRSFFAACVLLVAGALPSQSNPAFELSVGDPAPHLEAALGSEPAKRVMDELVARRLLDRKTRPASLVRALRDWIPAQTTVVIPRRECGVSWP